MLTTDPRHKPSGQRSLSGRAPMILLGVGLVLIIAAVFLVPMVLAQDGESTDEEVVTETEAGWKVAYIYDGATGQGAAITPDGKVLEAYNDMGRFIDSRVVARSNSVAFIGETLEIGPIPGDRSGPGHFSMDVPEDATVSVLGVPDRLVMAMHYEAGGDLLIIDADKRRVLDVGELLNEPNPNFTIDQLKLEPSGERYAIYNGEADETAVITLSKPQPSYFKHEGIAISTDRFATVTTADRMSTVTVYDNDGREVTKVTTEPIVSATMDGTTTYLVAENNDVMRLDDGDTDATVLARVPDSKKVAIAESGSRLIVDSPWGFTFIDERGAEIGQLRPGAGGVENPQRFSRCLATDVNELIARDADNNAVQRGPAVLRLNDLVLTAVTELPIHSSTRDGCTVATQIGETDTYQLLSATGELDLGPTGDIPAVGPYDRLFMSPNPNQWVALSPDKSVGLYELVDGEAQLIVDVPFPNVDYITVAFIPTSPVQ